MSRLPQVPVVYLAGGMRSNWQDRVIEALPGLLFIDPRRHGVCDERAYTAWDLTGVRQADIVLGYIERTNPNGAGLALEFGVAATLGKHLLYAEEEGFAHSRYFGMVRSVSDGVYSSLEAAIEALATLTGFVRVADETFGADHYVPAGARPVWPPAA